MRLLNEKKILNKDILKFNFIEEAKMKKVTQYMEYAQGRGTLIIE